MPATLSKMAKPTSHCWFIARLRRLMFACSLVSHTMRPMVLYCRGGAMQWPQHSLAVHGFTGMRTVVGAVIPSYAWSLQFKAQIGKNRAISSDELENSTKRVLRRKLFEEKEKKKVALYSGQESEYSARRVLNAKILGKKLALCSCKYGIMRISFFFIYL